MTQEQIRNAAIIAAANYDNPFDEPAYDKRFFDGFLAKLEAAEVPPYEVRVKLLSAVSNARGAKDLTLTFDSKHLGSFREIAKKL